MCEIAIKLLEIMKPFVENIENDLNYLTSKKADLNNINKVFTIIGDNSYNILNVLDEEINLYLNGFNSNNTEYQANKYILTSNVDEVKNLPQYINAKKYLDDFYEYLVNYFNKEDSEYKKLENEYSEKELVHKYYLMISEDKVFVNDIDELKKLFDILELSITEKNEIIIYILKQNNKSYVDEKINNSFSDYDKLRVIKILEENNNLKNSEYNELLDAVAEYVDINKNILDIVDYDLIEKINITNILLAKKVSLYRKICFLYYNLNCIKCNKVIDEFNIVNDLYEKTKNNKNQNEIVRIIKGEI